MLRNLVRKGLLDVLAANALAQMVGFVVLLLLPRFVDPETFGGIRVLQSIGDIVVLLAGFGYSTAILVTAAVDTPELRAQGFLNAAVRRTLQTSAMACGVATALAFVGAFGRIPLVERWLPLFALSAPAGALFLLLISWMQARERLRETARMQVLVRVQSAILVLVATWNWGVQGFVWGSVSASVLGLLLILRQVSTSFLRVRADRPMLFDRLAWHSMVANVFQVAGRQSDLLVLGVFAAGGEALGPYAVSTVLVLPIFVLAGAVQTTSLPGFSARKGEIPWLRSSVNRLQGETLFAAAALALAIRLVAPYLLSTLYPPSYAVALPFLGILLLHSVLRAGTSVYGAGQIAIGRTDLNAAASAYSAIAGLTAGYVGLRWGGLTGLAWAQVGVSATLWPLYRHLFRTGLRQALAED